MTADILLQLKVIVCPVISPSSSSSSSPLPPSSSSLQSECSRLQSLLLSPPCRWTSTMAFVSVFAVLTLAVAAEGNVGPSSNRSFCTESKECLEYQLVYAEAYFMGVGAAMAFRRLFQFITGANVGGVQMEMTAPVLVKIPEDTRMWEPAVYTLSFPLPAAYQEEPPVPTNDKMPEMDVYVRGYGGWMLSVTSRLHAHLLTKELGRVGASYNRSYHYGVGYDSPLKLLNRHNEVWYVSEGDVVCSDPQQPTPPHTPGLTPSPSPTDPASPPLTHTFSDSLVLPHTLSDSPILTPASSLSSESNSSDPSALPQSEASPSSSGPSTFILQDPTSNPPGNISNPPGNSTTLLPDAPPGNSTNPPGNSTILGNSTTLLPDALPGNSTNPPGNITTPPGNNSTTPPGNSTTPPGNSTTLLPSLTTGGPSADAPPEEAH
ncbi:Heme-binding protein 2 [Dissostichus eleginoides]|uniref:Heme-binding protein 1 n=1 Tax=Dissostichus eleginoides TaxID=100907 RepID=A0AAD9BNW1_DISEL|nr:Heme-binding protein 2 [Dissostichus eleginoides]